MAPPGAPAPCPARCRVAEPWPGRVPAGRGRRVGAEPPRCPAPAAAAALRSRRDTHPVTAGRHRHRDRAGTATMDDIFTQCREGNAVAVRLWLDNTENDLNQGDDHGFSPLHWACREGRSNVVDMLIMRGARINVMNRGDDTPLHLAASHGHRDIVQKLMQFKADINAVNEHGNTPLHYACFWGHEQVAEDLVGSGALVSIANKYGETPTDKAKTPLREVLKERAEKLGQSLTKIPYKDTFWKGTTRTRPRNGTLNKLAGIDFKQLSLSQKLNENQSGELWKGRWQGNDIVIKMLKIRDWTTRKSRDFNEEYPKLRIFSHPNVLPVLGACQAPPAPHPIVISHWMPYGSLYNVLHEGTNFVVDQMQAVKFAFDIARGMAFLHTLEPLIPRHHLNSRSVMIDEDMTARISMADVKFSFQCPGRMYAPAWVAPEGSTGGATSHHPPWHLPPHLQADEDLHERGPSQAPQVRYDRAHPGEDAGEVEGRCLPSPVLPCAPHHPQVPLALETGQAEDTPHPEPATDTRYRWHCLCWSSASSRPPPRVAPHQGSHNPASGQPPIQCSPPTQGTACGLTLLLGDGAVRPPVPLAGHSPTQDSTPQGWGGRGRPGEAPCGAQHCPRFALHWPLPSGPRMATGNQINIWYGTSCWGSGREKGGGVGRWESG
uniref:Integrin linked kinase n=1 Tax=Corvus moneduloides TaxID=1196302 RepID=A0A8U7MF06_CORMO